MPGGGRETLLSYFAAVAGPVKVAEPLDQPSLRLVNQRLSGTRIGASAQRQKAPVFHATIDQRQSPHSPRIKSRRNVADLMNPKLPGFNRFSNHLLHSEALTQ